MNWKLCITDPQMHALTLCRGLMDEGDGLGYGIGGSSSGWGYGKGYGKGVGFRDGDGYGDGYGAIKGGGRSPQEWK